MPRKCVLDWKASLPRQCSSSGWLQHDVSGGGVGVSSVSWISCSIWRKHTSCLRRWSWMAALLKPTKSTYWLPSNLWINLHSYHLLHSFFVWSWRLKWILVETGSWKLPGAKPVRLAHQFWGSLSTLFLQFYCAELSAVRALYQLKGSIGLHFWGGSCTSLNQLYC